jgi:hypothetical protein
VTAHAPVNALSQYDKDDGLPGLLIPTSRLFSGTGITPPANRAYVARFVPSRAMSITLAALAVNVAATANDACDIGVYDANGNRLVSTGSTTGLLNVAALNTVALAIALAARAVYYAAFAYGAIGGTAATIIGVTWGAFHIERAFGTAPPLVLAMFKDTAFPLPATLAGFSAASAAVAVPCALRES